MTNPFLWIGIGILISLAVAIRNTLRIRKDKSDYDYWNDPKNFRPH
jgi:hypothetical protein